MLHPNRTVQYVDVDPWVQPLAEEEGSAGARSAVPWLTAWDARQAVGKCHGEGGQEPQVGLVRGLAGLRTDLEWVKGPPEEQG